jgi:hypothetical protein
MPGILWLASYPKSGNTWLRAFLANYIKYPRAPVPIDDLRNFNFSDGTAGHFEKAAGRPVDTISFGEIQALRPKVHEMFAWSNSDSVFVKTHNAVTTYHGIPTITPEFTAGAIYVIRNPLDVAVSYAHHYGDSHETAINAMAANDRIMLPHLNLIHQMFGSWSSHVRSWTRAPGLECHVMRYEDMILKPEKTWRVLIKYLGLPLEMPRLKQAIKFSSFKVLANQEKEGGFVEAVEADNRAFFRKGKTGSWRKVLTVDQVKKLIDDHGEVMAEHGYLNNSGEPRF